MLNIRNRNGNLDEMQLQFRNKIGNQCYFMLFYSLFLGLFLKDHGVQWADSPISLLIIMMLSMGYYLIRIVLAGAYVGTLTHSKKNTNFMVGLLATMVITIGSLIIIFRTNIFKESFNISYSLVSIFFFVFIMVIVFSKISRRKNNEGND